MHKVHSIFATMPLALATAVSAAPPEFHTQVAAGGPLLWFKFNEAPGSVVFVNSGSLGVAFNADVPAGAVLSAATPGGDGGVQVNGSAGQFMQSDADCPASLTGDPTITCEAIVRMASNNSVSCGYPPFLYWGSNGTGRSVYFSLQHFSGVRPYVGFYNGGLRATCDQPMTRFIHLVWTHQGGAGQWGGSTLYVNGQAVSTEHDDVLIGAPTIAVTASPFYINTATDCTRRFAGIIDEVVLYDRVLSANEVSAHFATLTLPKCAADVTGLGGSASCAADGSVTPDDLIVYLSAFFGGNLAIADIASLGGNLLPDGQLTADDIIAFLSVFFAGCA